MADEQTPTDEAFKTGDTLEIPAQFLKALAEDAAANDAFDRLSAADQREFIDWVVEVKDVEGRNRRSAEAIDKLKDGRRPTD